MKTYIQIGFSIVYLPLTTVVGLVLNCEKMGSSAVLLFTAAALLLVLAELGQSAPAQEDQSLKEAMDNVHNQWREAVEKCYKQIAESQAHNSPEQLVQSQNYYRGAQAQGRVHTYCAVGWVHSM